MSILYDLVERKRPGDEFTDPKWYLSRVTTGRATVDVMAKRVARLSGHSVGVVKGVLHDLLEITAENLLSGNNVQIGNLGTCRLILTTEGAETEETFKLNSMKRAVKAVFVPSPTMKRSIAPENLQFVSIVANVDEAAVPEEPEEPEEPQP